MRAAFRGARCVTFWDAPALRRTACYHRDHACRGGLVKGQPFSLANLREVADALYGRRHWHLQLARNPRVPPRTFRRWFDGDPIPDVRQQLAELCQSRGAYDPAMHKLARKIEKLGPAETVRA